MNKCSFCSLQITAKQFHIKMHVEKKNHPAKIYFLSTRHSWRDLLYWFSAALLGCAASLKNFDFNQSASKACLRSMMLMSLSVWPSAGALCGLCGVTPWEQPLCAKAKIGIKGEISQFIGSPRGFKLQTFRFHKRASRMLMWNQSAGARGASAGSQGRL